MIIVLPNNRKITVVELRRRATCATCCKPIRAGQRAVITRPADGEAEYRHAHTDCLAPRSARQLAPCPHCGNDVAYAHRFTKPGAKRDRKAS